MLILPGLFFCVPKGIECKYWSGSKKKPKAIDGKKNAAKIIIKILIIGLTIFSFEFHPTQTTPENMEAGNIKGLNPS